MRISVNIKHYNRRDYSQDEGSQDNHMINRTTKIHRLTELLSPSHFIEWVLQKSLRKRNSKAGKKGENKDYTKLLESNHSCIESRHHGDRTCICMLTKNLTKSYEGHQPDISSSQLLCYFAVLSNLIIFAYFTNSQ